MNIKCTLGFHDWTTNCEKCSKCGKIEDHHDWSQDCEKCSKCSKTKENKHDWSKDCEQCQICSKKRDAQHKWNGCLCSQCHKTRDEQHKFINELCNICGQGTMTDPRDGNRYKVIRIGKQIMLAENLRYKIPNPKHQNWLMPFKIDEKFSNEVYGNFYQWEDALQTDKGLKGWHLPSKKEWEIFYDYLGGDPKIAYNQITSGGTGFNALLGGRHNAYGSFDEYGYTTYFWSATAEKDNVWAFGIAINYSIAAPFEWQKDWGFNVRLFRD